jgi:hypothetical protein
MRDRSKWHTGLVLGQQPRSPAILLRIALVGALMVLIAQVPLLAADTQGSDGVVQTESGYYYTIKKGDTLWDLSQRFANSPWQWPALWEENTRLIPNPHRIYPGQRIRLYKKQWADNLPAAPPEAMPPAQPPPSFRYFAIDKAGFIRKEPVPPSGVLLKAAEDPLVAVETDIVFIRASQPNPFRVGDKYVTYRTYPLGGDPPVTPHIGVQHLLTGLLEITKVEEKATQARVLKNYRAMLPDDLVMPYQPRDVNIPLQQSVAGLTGHIIAGEEHERYMGGWYVAFMDRGSNDGVKPGQSYVLTYDEKYPRSPGSRLTTSLATMDFGTMIVLLTEAETATVLVTDAKKQFYAVGTTFRSPQ